MPFSTHASCQDDRNGQATKHQPMAAPQVISYSCKSATHSQKQHCLSLSHTHPSHESYSFEILSLIQHCNILSRRIWTIASIFYISSSITNSKKSLQNFIRICRHKRVLPHELISYFNPLNNLISEVRINKIILKLNFLGTWIRKTSRYMMLALWH